MGHTLPTFIDCTPTSSSCQFPLTDCCALDRLGKSAESIYHARPAGISDLSKSLLEAWGIRPDGTRHQIHLQPQGNPIHTITFQEKIQIYLPPCGALIETALGICEQIGREQRSMFVRFIMEGYQVGDIDVSIRVDERLATPTCCSASNSHERMVQLKDTLKECKTGKPFGFTIEHPQPRQTSGTWFASHFDIRYLDERCYQQTQSTTGPTTAVDGLREALSTKDPATGLLFRSLRRLRSLKAQQSSPRLKVTRL